MCGCYQNVEQAVVGSALLDAGIAERNGGRRAVQGLLSVGIIGQVGPGAGSRSEFTFENAFARKDEGFVDLRDAVQRCVYAEFVDIDLPGAVETVIVARVAGSSAAKETGTVFPSFPPGAASSVAGSAEHPQRRTSPAVARARVLIMRFISSMVLISNCRSLRRCTT